ncbi:MAG: signal peptide peptidase SppA [Alphaproteobacteria bacterium]|nr:signal peptide peptidase SppA [Alphaproteobacteria bacterium]
MRRFVLGLFAALGILATLAIVGTGIVVWRIAASRPTLPKSIILTADLGHDLVEGSRESALSELVTGPKATMRGFLDALERAGDDSRVKGLYAHIGADSLGLAKIQELRDAIAAFRARGKFAVAFSESFGEFGAGTRPYYLATAFDEIWLQPLGAVGLVGLHSEQPFLRGALDKLGIEPSFEHREQYKTATNILTETEMTPPQREEVESLLSAMAGQIGRGIAETRHLSESEVQALIDKGPLFADEAKEAHLVDRIGYRDEAVVEAHRRAGSGAELLSLSRYVEGAGHPHTKGPTIALIYGAGLIVQGSSSTSPLTGTTEMSARQVTRAFRDAFRDGDVRAILFRIDSPGGSAVASESIWREVLQARERGKPVIVSMGDTAGSGGYYIAAPADKIVAQPATLTGSIGVLAGKLVITHFLNRLGITADSVGRGANSGMFSVLHDFSPAERQRLDAFLDRTYQGFKAHVAAGRHLSEEAVEAVAKGRVWSGEEAKKNGLVDELGGYAVALRLAKDAAKIPADAAVKLLVFPREKSTAELIFDRLFERDRDSDSAGAPSGAFNRAWTALSALTSPLDILLEDPGVLRMPTLGDIR